ncbi:unnamed protein product [Sphenostylis stenocarpa]|uniref:3'-5' exonuclease domain-containing protein n=1 Tax=Sphenostylis stenocarpa TaxID=92480 RepID=A0AA86SKA1_9FABA|nr:unnamed protein product [Sphenostylis stenocarpa]
MASVTHIENRFNHFVYTVYLAGDYINVTVTSSASVVKRWLSSTLHFGRHYVYLNRLVVGLGVQWTPGGYDPPPDTLQLCVGRRCLIFQLAFVDGVPESLRTFLKNPDHTFVGFWNHSDRRKLEYSEYELEMYTDPLDLRLVYDNLIQASVEEIVDNCLGFRVFQPREISMSRWSVSYLSNKQVAYAAVDAYCAFLIDAPLVPSYHYHRLKVMTKFGIKNLTERFCLRRKTEKKKRNDLRKHKLMVGAERRAYNKIGAE